VGNWAGGPRFSGPHRAIDDKTVEFQVSVCDKRGRGGRNT